jgi:putative Holliday junction resolvase
MLGIDYGSKRIGIAVSDPLNIIARGLVAIPNNAKAVEEIVRIAAEYEAATLVIGMPFNLKGEQGVKALEVEEFTGRLKAVFPGTIVHVDERFTSRQAQQTMLEMGTTRKQRRVKGVIDEMAAALILQSYLDQDGRKKAP